MDYEYYIRKYKYYRSWYDSMTAAERKTVVGKWVFGNCLMFCSLMQEIESQVHRLINSSTNYNNSAWN